MIPNYILSDTLSILKNKKTINKKHLSALEKYAASLPYKFCYSYPKTISLKVTSGCNLRCKHCFYSGTPEIYNNEYDCNTEELLEIITSFIEDFGILKFVITGGEPFLRNDIINIIKFIKEKYIPLTIQTNATLINEDNVQNLSKIIYPKTDAFQISIDGSNEETNDFIRGIGTFSKIINVIQSLHRYNIPVHINTTLTSVNAPTMYKIFDLCNKLNVKNLSINRFNVCNDKHKYLELSVEDKFYYNYQILQESKKYTNLNFNQKSLDIFDYLKIPEGRNFLEDYMKNNKIKYSQNTCFSCHNNDRLTMDAKGNIFLCTRDESKIAILGNLKKSKFNEIWENRFNNPYFQRRDITTTKCKNCKFIPICNTGCMISAFKTYGDINCAPAECPYFEEYQRSINE